MALNCGIVGLTNVGKTTIFQALSGSKAETGNYNFSTINPNVGIVNVNDKRLFALADIFKPKKTIPAIVEFVDISGLVKGSSKGEGLGNQFLAHIRDVGVIAHVVRCFSDPDVIHVSGKIDPEADIETINIELALADLDSLGRRRERATKSLKSQDKNEHKLAEATLAALDKISPLLENGRPARDAELTPDEIAAVYDCHFITMKPQLYVCNVDETYFKAGPNPWVTAVQKRAEREGSQAVVIAGKFEAD
ncbi:MAG: YchF family ATPase, partial [Treponema sp.]|nr:YchF family ATPase [Treponema sp.]